MGLSCYGVNKKSLIFCGLVIIGGGLLIKNVKKNIFILSGGPVRSAGLVFLPGLACVQDAGRLSLQSESEKTGTASSRACIPVVIRVGKNTRLCPIVQIM